MFSIYLMFSIYFCRKLTFENFLLQLLLLLHLLPVFFEKARVYAPYIYMGWLPLVGSLKL